MAFWCETHSGGYCPSRHSLLYQSFLRLLAKVEAEVVPPPRARRYVFHYDEVAEAEAQGLPYVLVPRELSEQEWKEKYSPKSEKG
jgi:hypothetical protein